MFEQADLQMKRGTGKVPESMSSSDAHAGSTYDLTSAEEEDGGGKGDGDAAVDVDMEYPAEMSAAAEDKGGYELTGGAAGGAGAV